jgi:hypothetical protein
LPCSAIAHAQSRGDALAVLDGNALPFGKGEKPLAVPAHFAGDAVRQFGKLFAFGLGNIEDVSRTEADQYRLILLCDVLFGFSSPVCGGRR